MEDNKNYIKVERHKWPDEIEAEKKRTRKRFLIVLSCIICFVAGFGLSAFSNINISGITNSSQNTNSDKFNEIYEIMQNDWYFGKDIENLNEFLLDNAINGLTTNDYDAHTNYLTSDSADRFIQKLEGSMVGIGVQYRYIGEQAMITRVYLNSPAEKVGLQAGDSIKKVNGISVEGKTLEEIADLVKGEEGTVVTVIIDRNGEELSFDITRETINYTSYGYVRDNVGILELSSFSERTHEESEVYFKRFKDENIDNIIIDMRNNTGGYLNTVIKIASMLMDEGKIVIQEKDRDGKIKELKTTGGTQYKFDNIVLLVNENTASASEALAACLKEQIDAKIVGAQTYGKGTEQISKIFSDGTYLKYTIAEWLTPNGNSINLKGITPDVEVQNADAISYAFTPEDASNKVDSVGANVKYAQMYLEFLGYTIDRKDGYFSNVTLTALNQYEKDNGLNINGVINKDVLTAMNEKCVQLYTLNIEKYDIQLAKAIEVSHGK